MDIANTRQVLKQRSRLCNQMASQHAYLRDKFSRRIKIVDVVLVTLAGILTFVSVAREEFLISIEALLRLPFDLASTIPVFSFLIFILSVLVWRVDWKGQSEAHAQALRIFAELRSELKTALNSSDIYVQEQFPQLVGKYDSAGETTVSIPEKYFNVTKRHHKLKVLESKFLDRYPGVNRLLFGFCVRLRHCMRAIGEAGKDEEQTK